MRVFHFLFLAVIGIILLAPVIQMLTGLVPVPKLEERRTLHTVAAPIQRALHLDPDLSDDVTKWFNDHYGFRDLLIRAKHEVDYQVFHVSDKVYIGDSGWLFDSAILNTIHENLRDTQNNADQIVHSVRDIKTCLASRGIQLIIVYNPSKTTIYPEHLPRWAPRPAQNGLAQQLAGRFASEPGLIFINGEDIVRSHKNETLFYKTDLHLNPKGGSYVYLELVRRLAELNGMPQPALRPISYVNNYWRSGSEERFLSKFLPVGEMLDSPLNTAARFKDDAGGRWTQNIGKGPVEGYPDLPIYDFAYQNLRTTPLLPPLVIAGSSFTDTFFDLGFHEIFQNVYRSKNNIATRMIHVLHNLPPGTRYVMIEYPEFFTKELLILPQANPCEPHTPSL